MNKQEIYELLRRENIRYELSEHKAVYNMAEFSTVEALYPECEAKNLFIRDDKKQHYYLITVKGDKRVNLKEFRKTHGTRALHFAPAEDLMEILGLIPGAVTPMGLLNDKDRRVALYLDQEFLGGLIGIHPNDNTATVWMAAEDLIGLIENHGNPVSVIPIESMA